MKIRELIGSGLYPVSSSVCMCFDSPVDRRIGSTRRQREAKTFAGEPFFVLGRRAWLALG